MQQWRAKDRHYVTKTIYYVSRSVIAGSNHEGSQDNIKMEIKEKGCDDMDWFLLAKNGHQWHLLSTQS
jgi:hypothetical protein